MVYTEVHFDALLILYLLNMKHGVTDVTPCFMFVLRIAVSTGAVSFGDHFVPCAVIIELVALFHSVNTAAPCIVELLCAFVSNIINTCRGILGRSCS